MSKIKLQRGTAVRRSIRGTKGFFYPDMNGGCLMLREDCDAERQAGWNDYGAWRAVIIPSESMSKKDRYDGDTERMVVWVKNG